MNLTPDQEVWIDRAREADILGVAQRAPVHAKLRRFGREYVGPCPSCGGDDRFAINPAKRGGIFICRGFGGGDVVAMVRHVCGVEFLAACEIINGEPMPAADRRVSPEEIKAAAEAREAERAARDAERAREESAWREREREAAFEIWQSGAAFAGSPAEAYLRGRGLDELPERAPLRFAPMVAYFHGDEVNELGRRAPRVVYRGPAMLAPIVDPADGRFRAVHITWIDPDRAGRKAAIRNPDDGALLLARKVRGSKAGNVIKLQHMSASPSTLYIGEGIETVLSVWLALLREGRRKGAPSGLNGERALTPVLRDSAFWSAVDLGNIGGKSRETVPHPTLKTEAGRVRRIQGPDPLLGATALAIPDSVTDLVLLGDGDSDRFTTQCALARATARYAVPGRAIRTAWAPDGQDFNDVVMGELGQ